MTSTRTGPLWRIDPETGDTHATPWPADAAGRRGARRSGRRDERAVGGELRADRRGERGGDGIVPACRRRQRAGRRSRRATPESGWRHRGLRRRERRHRRRLAGGLGARRGASSGFGSPVDPDYVFYPHPRLGRVQRRRGRGRRRLAGEGRRPPAEADRSARRSGSSRRSSCRSGRSRSRSAPAPSGSPVSTTTSWPGSTRLPTTVTMTIPLGAGTDGVAVGEGSVWVVSTIAGTVTRIDPETGDIQATIDVGERPEDVAVGSGGRVGDDRTPHEDATARHPGCSRLPSPRSRRRAGQRGRRSGSPCSPTARS